jgi:hypothetical protein
MVDGIRINNRSYKSMSRLNIEILGSLLIFNSPVPSGFNLAEGIEQKEQEGKSDNGESVRLFSFPTARKGSLSVSYAHMQDELVALRTGVQLEERSYSTRYPVKLWVTKGEYAPAGEGKLGYGLSEDVNIGTPNGARGSVTRGELSVPITQAVWADYAIWRTNPLQFAIGANGALRFSDDIVAMNDVSSLSIPVTGTVSLFSDKSVGTVRLEALVVDNLDRVHFIEIYNATIDLSDAGVDMGSDTMDLKFFLNTPPGYCRSWNMITPKTNNLVACVAG